jgi:hypothetical protein
MYYHNRVSSLQTIHEQEPTTSSKDDNHLNGTAPNFYRPPAPAASETSSDSDSDYSSANGLTHESCSVASKDDDYDEEKRRPDFLASEQEFKALLISGDSVRDESFGIACHNECAKEDSHNGLSCCKLLKCVSWLGSLYIA